MNDQATFERFGQDGGEVTAGKSENDSGDPEKVDALAELVAERVTDSIDDTVADAVEDALAGGGPGAGPADSGRGFE